MGLGGVISAVPGISAIGTATSIASVCGVDRTYGLNMALLMNLAITAGLAVPFWESRSCVGWHRERVSLSLVYTAGVLPCLLLF